MILARVQGQEDRGGYSYEAARREPVALPLVLSEVTGTLTGRLGEALDVDGDYPVHRSGQLQGRLAPLEVARGVILRELEGELEVIKRALNERP